MDDFDGDVDAFVDKGFMRDDRFRGDADVQSLPTSSGAKCRRSHRISTAEKSAGHCQCRLAQTEFSHAKVRVGANVYIAFFTK